MQTVYVNSVGILNLKSIAIISDHWVWLGKSIANININMGHDGCLGYYKFSVLLELDQMFITFFSRKSTLF